MVLESGANKCRRTLLQNEQYIKFSALVTELQRHPSSKYSLLIHPATVVTTNLEVVSSKIEGQNIRAEVIWMLSPPFAPLSSPWSPLSSPPCVGSCRQPEAVRVTDFALLTGVGGPRGTIGHDNTDKQEEDMEASRAESTMLISKKLSLTCGVAARASWTLPRQLKNSHAHLLLRPPARNGERPLRVERLDDDKTVAHFCCISQNAT